MPRYKAPLREWPKVICFRIRTQIAAQGYCKIISGISGGSPRLRDDPLPPGDGFSAVDWHRWTLTARLLSRGSCRGVWEANIVNATTVRLFLPPCSGMVLYRRADMIRSLENDSARRSVRCFIGAYSLLTNSWKSMEGGERLFPVHRRRSTFQRPRPAV